MASYRERLGRLAHLGIVVCPVRARRIDVFAPRPDGPDAYRSAYPDAFELSYGAKHFGACHSIDVPLAFATLDGSTGRLFFGDHPTSDASRCRTNSARHVLATPSSTTYPEEESRRIRADVDDVISVMEHTGSRM
jgi:hypothetical protein